jgi:flagellar hook-associated protein 1
MSLMSSLYVGVTGLNVSQNALNTTAHNLANVQTKGFTRQQVVQVDRNYLNIGVNHISTLQTGMGVNIATVKQVRDMFLDQSYRKELGRQGFYDVQYEAVQEVEGMFGELEGVAFQDSLDDLWTSLQELAKEPDSLVARKSLVQTSVSFIERAEMIGNQLKEYQVNLNTQIINKVNRVNGIADGIKELNDKIRRYESTRLEKANDLRDERNNLLDELGQIVSITYKENSTGVVTVNAEGVPIVTEDQTFKMDVTKVSDSTDMLKPIWPYYGNVDVFNLDRATSSANDTDIGSLKGLLVARGSDTANYKDIPIKPVEPLMKDYGTVADYNTAYADYESKLASYNSDVTDYNNRVNASVLMTVQAQFDQLVHGIVTTLNDVLSPNTTATIPSGASIKYPDGTIVNLTADTDYLVLDEDKAPIGMDADKTMGEALFNRKSVDRYTTVEVTYPDSSVKTIKVYNEEKKEDNYSLFTLGEIEVNPEILSNVSKIPLSTNGGGDGFDIKAAQKLVDKWQEAFATLSPNTLTKNNFNDYYTALISDLANRGDQLNNISTNQESMVNNIDSQRQQTAGVSSDEELTNLIKYQHAYNASSRYITTVSDMLEHIIMRLGN